jgi:glycosyltransferase involved in cell wall biosynthesis
MSAVYSIPACSLLGIRLVNGMVADSPVQQNIRNKHWLRARLTFPFAHAIVGNSKSGLQAYDASKKKGVVIYNGFDFGRLKNLKSKVTIRNQLKIGPDEKLIGMAGAFSDKKDYRTYFRAAQILLSKNRKLVFLAMGRGTDGSESLNLIDKEYRDHFRLLGRTSGIESYINALDISVLATFTEGISNFILESMALEKPVVATVGGGTREIVVDMVTGFLVESGNPEKLAEKLEMLLNDPQLCENTGKAGKERVQNSFSIGKMIDRYVILYNNILAGKQITSE